MGIRAKTVGACVVAIVTAAFLSCFAGAAWAGASVTIQSGNPRNTQTITVTGSGFPVHVKDPTGLQIIECSDPGGTVANLPSSAATCDGSTVNPDQINTDSQGNFTATYQVFGLNDVTEGSNINCDKTHFCVLWVGVDYNGNFLGAHAFSSPFEVGAPSPSTGSSSWIFIVIAIVVVCGAAFLVVRSRRRRSPPPPTSPAGVTPSRQPSTR